jgi:long-chain fatty acid transport protein
MTRIRTLFKLTPIAALFMAGTAFATDGYFPHGYGIKAKGMGGASVALAQDSQGGANNPASMAWVGNRLDLGLDLFSPHRDATRSDGVFAQMNGSVDSNSTNFIVPDFGYNHMLNPDLALGVSVYGNGGMNTNYPQGSFQCPTSPTTVAPANMLCGSGPLGIDLMQLVIAPTVAYKLNEKNSIGVSLLVGYQQFKAYGLQAFAPMSSDANSLTNNGYSRSHGVGIRLGYLGRISDQFSVGLSYAPKMSMSRFSEYKGLFADGGKFDIPAHYAAGVAFMPTPAVTVALDFERIMYSGVASVGDASSVQLPLGAPGGPGFGWKDINVVKLGLQWQATPALTLRAGYNHSGNPVTSDNVTFNILAPGVITRHYTAGFTYAMNPTDEISAALMIAPRESVSGPSMYNNPQLFPPSGLGATETIRMRETSIGLSWSHKF